MKWWRAVLSTVALLLVSPVAAPQLLAFPYSGQIGARRVYSEAPLTPELERIVAAADALAAQSPIAVGPADTSIFLTKGGWRWTWLTLTSRGAFAITRPLTENIVVNRSDAAADMVFTTAEIGGRRSLSGTIAHEMPMVRSAGISGCSQTFVIPPGCGKAIAIMWPPAAASATKTRGA